jgi:DNA-binding MarR family transcriptional regulator
MAVPAKSQALDALDAALVGMRRLWLQHPERRRRFLSKLGVSVEFACVRTVFGIAGLGDTPGPSVAEIADLLIVDPSTASRLVQQTVDAGFVTREPHPEDRRRVTLHLTTAGKALVARGRVLRRQWLRTATSSWSERDIATLGKLMARLHDDLDCKEL